MVTPANSFVFLVEGMRLIRSSVRLNPSVFSSNLSFSRLNRSVFRPNPGEIHHKFFSTDSGEDARFDESSAGIEPRPKTFIETASRTSLLGFTPANSFISLLQKIDGLELGHQHLIEDVQRGFLDTKERMREMDSRFQNQLTKIDHRFDARFDRLERSKERWLFNFLGLVSYLHYSYPTAFSKDI